MNIKELINVLTNLKNERDDLLSVEYCALIEACGILNQLPVINEEVRAECIEAV